MAENTTGSRSAYNADGIEILFFNIGESIYGIEIKYVKEIISVEQITVVPKIPDYIKGVINIRGKVVPIISVRNRFGIEEIPYDDRTCIIVLEFDDGEQVGIIVDRVQEVLTAKPGDLSKAPDSKNVNANRYIKSIIEIENDIKLLLDCDKLISD
ncbi:MAG: chemotaxis protein CheW [Oscillospiraceae bacterium]|nr:chemotaxis protein CheW [Oscillospiraceae bacterium]MDE7279544.1 chemotaxis protein CheW [Oscillospiraceae bacterium]